MASAPSPDDLDDSEYQQACQLVSRDSETRIVRLKAPSLLGVAEHFLRLMRSDRPHMAGRLSKLAPLVQGDERHWGDPVTLDQTHIWAAKAIVGATDVYVGIVWFDVGQTAPLTGSVQVLWVHPRFRQFGFGSQLVQAVFVRYPEIPRWTAFTSRDLRKDPGVHRFWAKNGFAQASLEVGSVTQDGFFVRTTDTANDCALSKRRRVQTRLFSLDDYSPPTPPPNRAPPPLETRKRGRSDDGDDERPQPRRRARPRSSRPPV